MNGEIEDIDYGDFNIEMDALNLELEAFAAAVENREEHPIPQEQIIHAVAVLESIIQSSKTKELVHVS